jgi:hypothetical protein
MNRKKHEAATERVLACLAAIDYDLGNLTIEGFARWLEHRRGRPIVFVPRHMPATVFGAWVSADDRDHVFYEADTPPLHQAHICLHEMAHMLLGHPTVRVDAQETQALLRGTGPDLTSVDSLLLRSTHTDEVEQEAELLATLIQDRALRHTRSRALAATTAQDRNLAGFIELLEIG